MPEAYGGVTVDYCLGQKKTECKSGRGIGEVKHRKRVQNISGKTVIFFSVVIKLQMCVKHLKQFTANSAPAKHLPREEIPHGHVTLAGCHAQWVHWMILRPDVKPVGRRARSPVKLR